MSEHVRTLDYFTSNCNSMDNLLQSTTKPLTREEKLAQFKDLKSKAKAGTSAQRPALAGLVNNATRSTPFKPKTTKPKHDTKNATTSIRKSVQTSTTKPMSSTAAARTTKSLSQSHISNSLHSTRSRSVSSVRSQCNASDAINKNPTFDCPMSDDEGVHAAESSVPSTTKLETDMTALQSRLSEESNKSIRFQIELEARATEVLALRSSVVQLQQELRSLRRDQIEQLDTEERLRAEVIEREEIVKHIQNEWSTENTAFKAKLKDKDQLVDELGQLVSKLREEVESLKSQPQAYADVWIQQVRVEELESQVQIQEAQILQDANKIENLNMEIKDCYDAISTFEEQESKHVVEVLKLETEIEQLKTTAMSIESVNFMLEKELERVKEHAHKIETALKHTLDENETVHKTAESNSEELKEAYTAIDLLEAQIKDLEEDAELMRRELTKNSDITSEFIIQGMELQKLNGIHLECAELKIALQEALKENKELVSKTCHSDLRHIDTQTSDFNLAESKHCAACDHSQNDAMSCIDNYTQVDSEHTPIMCEQACQSMEEYDPESWDKQITLLKFAYHVATEKHKKDATQFANTLMELEAQSALELTKWNTTSAEQKALIDKLWSGVSKSAERIKALEKELEEQTAVDIASEHELDDDLETEDEELSDKSSNPDDLESRPHNEH
ncbi:hypothetical protein QVD99_006750 [Batrachochytrium dendrobatidis]|nr:hypothetical protein QVD99_006750 [Batrachochytrium dendrobatidis]